MTLRTYADASPKDIRMGDIVGARDGVFTAHSDAEMDQWGDYNILDENGRYRAYGPETRVTITLDEDTIDEW
jgi:hypothetical protein